MPKDKSADRSADVYDSLLCSMNALSSKFCVDQMMDWNSDSMACLKLANRKLCVFLPFRLEKYEYQNFHMALTVSHKTGSMAVFIKDSRDGIDQ